MAEVCLEKVLAISVVLKYDERAFEMGNFSFVIFCLTIYYCTMVLLQTMLSP